MRVLNFTTTVALLLCHTLSAQIFDNNTEALTHAEQMPYFPGCEDYENNSDEKRQCSNHAIVAFISNYLVYPETARNEEIEGSVYVSFVVDAEGDIIEPSILKDIGGGCGEASLAVIAQMPKWEPGEENGARVAVKLNLPIQFSLKAEERDLSENYNIYWGNLMGSQISSSQLKENLYNTILIRDPLGETYHVNDLVFTFEKKKRLINAQNDKGKISKELTKIVEKAKKGGTFTITASIQDNGAFVWVSRSFNIVD